MDKLLREVGAVPRPIQIPSERVAAPAAPLLAVLWRRRWVLLPTVLICLLAAAAYLYTATPIFSSVSKVAIAQNGPRVFTETQGYVGQSENFMQTQADLFLSTAVLTRALNGAEYRKMNTFANLTGDPVAGIRNYKGFKVEAAKKSDVLVVTMESPYPREAAAFVNSIVLAYIEEQSADKRSAGDEMMKILKASKYDLQLKLDATLARMVETKRSGKVFSFKEDKGNLVAEQVERMSESLMTAQLETIAFRSQRDSIKASLESSDTVAAFVEAQQAKGREAGDQEYQELRTQLNTLLLNQATSAAIQGSKHPRTALLQSTIDDLRQRMAIKQRKMVEAQLIAANAQVVAAESKEKQTQAALDLHEGKAQGMIPQAIEYASLEAKAAQLQKQLEPIDTRIAEISVNTAEMAPLNIKVLEQARAEETPIKPNKPLVMAAALMLGFILGMGLAVLRESQDARLHTPEEILAVLGTPVLATVPRINPRLSSTNRGQMVRLDSRSITAEAYRSVRTSLYLGIGGKAKSILVASPMPGDGKSTTASNLAIAFAQAGDRTLLIDCDLREPVQHLIFENDGKVGLSNVMTGEVKLRDAVRPTRSPNLYLLPCGPIPGSPSELLGSKKFARLIQALSKSFDRIVIDSSPLLRFADGRILAASADATVLVLRMNQSMRTLGVVAINGLTKVGANVVGAVANDVPSGGTYPYYGGSSQYFAQPRAAFSNMDINATDLQAAATARPTERNAAEALSISEPDWAVDVA